MASPAIHAQESDSGEAKRLSTVTVTATQRESDIQSVPIAVTALDPVQLEREGVADITNLESVAPSFGLSTSGTQTGGIVLRLRGVGTTGNNIGLESAVGVFIDGVYLSRPGAALADLLDLEQVEVLRGPQGTLFGRNTSAGALVIRTKAPELDEFGGFANATIGNYGLYNVQGGVNIPIAEDTLAVRLSGAVRQRDGFVDGLDGNESHTLDRLVLRGQALWDAGSAGEARLIVDYADGDDKCCHAIWHNESATANFPAFGLPVQAGAPNIPGPELDEYNSNDGEFINPFEQFGVSLQYEVDTPVGALTYIGSFRDYEAQTAREADFTALRIYTVGASQEARALGGQKFDPNNNLTSIETTTHELRLQNTAFDDRLDWLVGLYYSDEKIDQTGSLTLLEDFQAGVSGGLLGAFPLQPNPLFLVSGGADATGDFATSQFLQDSESFSIFTHNVISLTDQLSLTLGARYVEDTKDGSYEQIAGEHDACIGTLQAGAANFLGGTGVALNCFVFAAPTIERLGELAPALLANPFAQALLPREFDDTFEDDEVVYTAKLGYALNADTNIYGGFTHGYKSGGFNLDSSAAVAGADPRFDSEIVDAWEFGLKTDFWDGRARTNIAIFHQEMEDFQVLEFTGTQFQTFNVGKAISSGVEFEGRAQLTNEFSGALNVSYTDARYPDDCAISDPSDPDFNARSANLCGASLTNAPEWVVVTGGTYERTVFDGAYNFFANASARYESDRRTSTQPTVLGNPELLSIGDIQEANTKVNLRLGLAADDGRWAVELWGRNIFDERTKNVTFNVPLRGGAANRARAQFIQEPATYGVTVRTNF
ncbi:MAG: TonB-dependent receptor [Pseudomonadota bacterium]